MLRPTAFLSMSVLAQLTAFAQDEEALAKGQKYLDKVAKVWSDKLPQEKLCGIYFGRSWAGSMKYTVKAAPAGSGAAYEVTLEAELDLMGQTMKSNSRALLASNLSPLSAESTETTPKSNEKRSLTVADGKWKVKEDQNGEVKEREGKITPGITFEGNLLPLFAPPDEDCRILSLDSNKGVNDFKKLPAKAERSFDGKKVSCTVVQIGHGEGDPEMWYLGADGRGLEFQPDGPIRVRPITEAQRGKKLNEPLEVKPAERRVLDLFLAIKKNDSAGVEGSFDFDRLSSESVPNFAGLTPEKKKETVETMRSTMLKNLLTEEMRSQFPDAALLEDALAQSLKTTEKDGISRVQVQGAGTWKLYQPKDGPRKGQWLVFGIDQE
jgi:hypothetical protein